MTKFSQHMSKERYETPRSSNSQDRTLLQREGHDLETSKERKAINQDLPDDDIDEFQDYFDIVNSQDPDRLLEACERATPLVSVVDNIRSGQPQRVSKGASLPQLVSPGKTKANTPRDVEVHVQRRQKAAQQQVPNYMRPI